MAWYGVRCIFEVEEHLYEERILIWQAATFSDALQAAEGEAREYAGQIEGQYLGLTQGFSVHNDLGNGTEVFSLIRREELAPEEYLDTFFNTGKELQEDIG